jgi:hypothetical protein
MVPSSHLQGGKGAFVVDTCVRARVLEVLVCANCRVCLFVCASVCLWGGVGWVHGGTRVGVGKKLTMLSPPGPLGKSPCR